MDREVLRTNHFYFYPTRNEKLYEIHGFEMIYNIVHSLVQYCKTPLILKYSDDEFQLQAHHCLA